MVNYSNLYKDKTSRSTFIKNFKVIGNDIKLYLGNGETTVIPANKNNLQMIREKMIEQGKEIQKLLPTIKKVNFACKVLTVTGVVGAIALNPGIGALIAGGITLISGCGCITTKAVIKDIRKIGIFIKHRKTINREIMKNNYMLSNVNENDYAKIQSNIEQINRPISIENIDGLSYESIRIIWNNIKVSRKLDVDYKYDYQYQKKKASY